MMVKMTTSVPRSTPHPSLLRRLNERAIFETLLKSGSASRAELMRALGVTAPTVHKAVASLVEAGLVEEVGHDTSKGVGRPGMVYRVASKSVQVVGVALGARRTSVLAAGLDGKMTPSGVLSFDTPADYDSLLDAIERRVSQLLRPDVQTLGIGISAPGGIDTDDQRILLSPNLHITDGKSPAKDLQARLHIEAIITHDTTGTCLAEWKGGAARGLNDFVMISAFEGLGLSVVTEGRLLGGRSGLGTELGHVTVVPNGVTCGCGNKGCLETVATDTAFLNRVQRKTGQAPSQPLTIDQVIQATQAGQLDVAAELHETLEFLAVGVAAAINLFNPQAVLLCARMFDVAPDAFDTLMSLSSQKALHHLRDRCRFFRADGDTSRGAIAGIIHHITGSIGPVI
jgi:predicted NBD/HSP70 family sugar kinase